MAVCINTGKVFGIFFDLVFKRAWSKILQPILHTSAEEAYEDRYAAL